MMNQTGDIDTAMAETIKRGRKTAGTKRMTPAEKQRKYRAGVKDAKTDFSLELKDLSRVVLMSRLTKDLGYLDRAEDPSKAQKCVAEANSIMGELCRRYKLTPSND